VSAQMYMVFSFEGRKNISGFVPQIMLSSWH